MEYIVILMMIFCSLFHLCRLDRLFVLLETGSTPSTRKAAAQQLGQVQRLHPHELPYLLQRVHKCLRSSSWETRIAAGQAVDAILTQVPVWPENNIVAVKVENDEDEQGSSKRKDAPLAAPEQLSFEAFDVSRLLSTSANLLMASESKCFEKGASSTDPSDQTKQRDLINKRLGLDMAEKMGIDTSDIISNDDLAVDVNPDGQDALEDDIFVPAQEKRGNGKKLDRHVSLIFDRSNSCNSVSMEDEESLSSREINLAKRRARKAKSREVLDSQSSVDDSVKKFKREDSVDLGLSTSLNEFIANFNALVEDGQWPLSGWVDILVNDLFHSQWEIRHGSATALREVIRLHGRSGGRRNIPLQQVCVSLTCSLVI